MYVQTTVISSNNKTAPALVMFGLHARFISVRFPFINVFLIFMIIIYITVHVYHMFLINTQTRIKVSIIILNNHLFYIYMYLVVRFWR